MAPRSWACKPKAVSGQERGAKRVYTQQAQLLCQEQCLHRLAGGRKACAPTGCPVPSPGDAGRRAQHIQQGMPKFQLLEILNRVLFRLM